jgi:peroxiredoxin
VKVLAVSVDPAWSAVRSFVDAGSLEHVHLASAEDVADAFGVVELPQTFVIDSAGILRLHFRGPQDWSSRAVRTTIADLKET